MKFAVAVAVAAGAVVAGSSSLAQAQTTTNLGNGFTVVHSVTGTTAEFELQYTGAATWLALGFSQGGGLHGPNGDAVYCTPAVGGGLPTLINTNGGNRAYLTQAGGATLTAISSVSGAGLTSCKFSRSLTGAGDTTLVVGQPIGISVGRGNGAAPSQHPGGGYSAVTQVTLQVGGGGGGVTPPPVGGGAPQPGTLTDFGNGYSLLHSVTGTTAEFELRYTGTTTWLALGFTQGGGLHGPNGDAVYCTPAVGGGVPTVINTNGGNRAYLTQAGGATLTAISSNVGAGGTTCKFSRTLTGAGDTTLVVGQPIGMSIGRGNGAAPAQHPGGGYSAVTQVTLQVGGGGGGTPPGGGGGPVETTTDFGNGFTVVHSVSGATAEFELQYTGAAAWLALGFSQGGGLHGANGDAVYCTPAVGGGVPAVINTNGGNLAFTTQAGGVTLTGISSTTGAASTTCRFSRTLTGAGDTTLVVGQPMGMSVGYGTGAAPAQHPGGGYSAVTQVTLQAAGGGGTPPIGGGGGGTPTTPTAPIGGAPTTLGGGATPTVAGAPGDGPPLTLIVGAGAGGLVAVAGAYAVVKRQSSGPPPLPMGPKPPAKPMMSTPPPSMGMGMGAPAGSPMGSPWRAAQDPNSGRTYYYNKETREVTWTAPPGMGMGGL